MIYDLDASMYLAPTCYGRATLIATLEQRHNLLSVLSTYRNDSLKNGYASPTPERAAKSRDRTRALQLWNHAVLNQATIALTFGVNRRTLSHFWGTQGTKIRPRVYGRVNPDHCSFLTQLLEHHHRHEPIPLTDDSVLAVLCSDPNPELHTNLTAAANLLGITRQGDPMICVGITDVTPPPRPAHPPVESTRVINLDQLPTLAEAQRAEPVTEITDPDTRDAVEAGDVPYAPKVDFDDTGDRMLAELDSEEIEHLDLDDTPEENEEESANL